MEKASEKREARIAIRSKNIIKSLDNTWHVLDDTRVPIVRQVLGWLDHPDQKLKIIHIAGTNGKSSTGAMMGAVLQANGYSYGRFSSPFILSAREQICIDDEMISKNDFVDFLISFLYFFFPRTSKNIQKLVQFEGNKPPKHSIPLFSQ